MVRRSTWILLGVFGVAAIAFVVWQRAPQSEPPVPTEARASLWEVESGQVDSLRVEDLNGGAVVAARRDPDVAWRMISPVGGDADIGRIELGVASVASPSVRQTLADPEDLAAFGLEPPAYRMTLFLKDGTSVSADIGSLDPTGSVYYVRIPAADGVWMISRYSLEDALGWLVAPPVLEPVVGATETP